MQAAISPITALLYRGNALTAVAALGPTLIEFNCWRLSRRSNQSVGDWPIQVYVHLMRHRGYGLTFAAGGWNFVDCYQHLSG